MELTSFQNPQIRDSNDNIIQAGAYGKNSPFCNAQNTGILDYINNNLMYLYDVNMGITDYIVDSGQSSDGTIWYRQWKSGWLEQGGYITPSETSSRKEVWINFVKNYANADYNIVKNFAYASSSTPNYYYINCYSKQVHRFAMSTAFGSAQTNNDTWYACGMGAEE